MKKLRNIQLFWSFFIAVGAYFGAFMMIFDPTGKTLGIAEMLPFFQKLPFADVFFRDFLFPGIALFICNGLTNTLSVILIFRKNNYAALSGIFCGIILILWICVQFYLFPLNFMSVIFFVFGMLQALNGFLWIRKEKIVSSNLA